MLQVGRRVMIGASLFFCGCGCVLMIEVGDEPISLSRYLTSLSIILAFTNILEGVTMSVMGDVIHPLMAAGFWNAGTPLTPLLACHMARCQLCVLHFPTVFLQS